jgi:hypothetical protein
MTSSKLPLSISIFGGAMSLRLTFPEISLSDFLGFSTPEKEVSRLKMDIAHLLLKINKKHCS